VTNCNSLAHLRGEFWQIRRKNTAAWSPRSQAINRFRGADVHRHPRRTGQNSLLYYSQFSLGRTDSGFVNRRFEKVLSEAAGQPGFSELSPTNPRLFDGDFDVARPPRQGDVQAIEIWEAVAGSAPLYSSSNA
jgi:hypothetical protein